jgi:hypothetical protein
MNAVARDFTPRIRLVLQAMDSARLLVNQLDQLGVDRRGVHVRVFHVDDVVT